MASIDLERLIVRQKYFIPIEEPELRNSILKELKAHEQEIPKVPSWFLSEEHRHSFSCDRSFRHLFVFRKTLGKRGTGFSKLVRQKIKEYKDGLPKTFWDELGRRIGDAPYSVHVNVINAEKEGCTCEVSLFPTLYSKLRILKSKRQEVTEFDLQNAYLRSKTFLKDIFESGLSATLISEEKRKPLKPAAQLLVNDQLSHKILVKTEEMLDEATGEILLCGWIGTILLPKLKEIKEKGVNIRVITHKAVELKGQPGKQDVQRAFGELISMISKDNISIRPECHFRVVVVDNKALIGSMDLNAISLTGAHRELAIYTEDPEIVRNLRNYFNGIFSPLSKEKAK